MTAVELHPLTPERWPDFVELFERRGPRGGYRNAPAYGCWCMYWRDRSLEHGDAKKRAMERIVRDGREPGLLAYDGGDAVGWIAVAPREEYPVLLRSPQYRPRDDDEGVWSIACIAVDRPLRARGVAHALVGAAAVHARARGASAVEAYPHASNAGDYMGSLDLYLAHAFRDVRAAGKRVVVRRTW